MSERMIPIPFAQLMNWLATELQREGTAFGVHRPYWAGEKKLPIFGEEYIETPFGPAAGPNTQLAQNIIASYFAGARFFELKTVQKMDGADLAACVNRPCILAEDECYNCEWSTELYVPEAYEEYVKAWFALKILAKVYGLGDPDGFVFNMSVGYDLAGIQGEKVNKFITERMDTDPVFYKKFSQLLKETIEAYEQGRISEIEYLKRVSKYKEDVLAHTDKDLPGELQHNNAGKAYYGITLETYQRIFADTGLDLCQMALETTRRFDEIINKTLVIDGNVLVDWQSKSDIIGRMKIELEDYLIDEVKRKYNLKFPFDDMDVIIDGCVDVAKLWIK